jgi:hypothetical protein
MLNKTQILSILEFSKEHWPSISTLVVGLSLGTSIFYAESYFEKFGLSYLHFVDFTDLIKLLFLSKTFFISIILLSGLFILASLLGSKEEVTESKVNRPKTFFTVVISLVLVPVIFFILIAPFTSPSLDASSIKNGYAAFYNIVYHGGKSKVKCASIIAASSNNYLVWDFKNSKTIIIPKSQIIDFHLTLEKFKSKAAQQDVDTKIEELEERKQKLAKVCEHV